MLLRNLEKQLKRLIKQGHSALILGPRQVGKTTLIESLLKDKRNSMSFLLQNPSTRMELEKDPAVLIRQIEANKKRPLVFIDEAQKIPELFDAIQYLLDKNLASFIITGSSARKLRRKGTNLLPGRIKYFHMDPFTYGELGLIKENYIPELRWLSISRTILLKKAWFLGRSRKTSP
ncbi:AAA family ATPase [Candidatus Margulisiibacteriota bacterium]